ncbi:hypothetical protein OROMI_009192 [Orobanche minor]
MTFNKSQGQTLDKALMSNDNNLLNFSGLLTSVTSPLARALLEPKIFPLDAITPETKNWTAKVSIVNKTEPRTSSQPASIRFQKLLLADNRENRVEAMLYRGDIELLKNSLRIDQTYLISNAVVRPVKPGFENPLANNKYQWILGARTAILATDEDVLVLSKLAPTFTHSDLFRDFLGKRTLISTAAIIIDSHPPRTVTAKGKENTLHEYAAIDELLNPFIITFWNDVAPDDVYSLLSSTKERHIIAALNFSVSDYHSNTTLFPSSLPSAGRILNACRIFRNGELCIHKESVDILQQQGDVFRKAQTNFSHDPEIFASIETLLTTEQPNRYDLLARGKVTRSNQNFIYPCCAKCHRLTSAAYGRSFECHSFHEIRSAIPRFRFSLLVYDDSGEIEVTVFGDEGKKLMQMSANDFLTQYCNVSSINSNMRQMKLKMKIQSKVFNKQDGTTTMSHTMQTLECHQLASTASPAGIANVSELSAPQKNEPTFIPSTTKEHPRPCWNWCPRMSDNGSVPSPPMKDSDHLFGPSEIGPKFAYEAGIRRKIISDNDVFPEWAGYIRRLRACELEEGGSLCNHILEMMNYMNRFEYLDTNFDKNLAVPLLLRSLPDSYNDFLWKNHFENKSKTWIEIINELRRYEENKITQIGKLEEEKGKEKRKEKHYALDAQEGSSKRRNSCSWRDLGNRKRKCPKNIEESMGSSS